LKKSPLKDLHRVVEHPERLNNRLLEQTECQEGIIFLHLREKEEGIIFLRGLSLREAQKRHHLGAKTLQECRSQNPSRIRDQSSGGVAVLYAQARTQVVEFTGKGEQRSRPLRIWKFFQV
jgi:hypothetical protein